MSIDRPQALLCTLNDRLYVLLPGGHQTFRDKVGKFAVAIDLPFMTRRPCYRMSPGNRGLLELLIEQLYPHWEVQEFAGVPPWVRDAMTQEALDRVAEEEAVAEAAAPAPALAGLRSGSLLSRATLRGLFDGCGVSQEELARRTGLTERHVGRLWLGQAPVTPEIAHQLESATRISARLWLRSR